MPSLKLCIAMCTYNGAAFIEQQLASIATQTHLPDRMVVVDDGSIDTTLERVHEFVHAAPFPVRVIRNTANLGYARNFAKAVALSEGDVVVLADQDDVWVPHKLARIEEVFRQSPETGLVFSDAEVVDAGLHPLGFRLWNAVRFTPRKQAQVRNGHTFHVLIQGNVVTGATMAFAARFRPVLLPMPGSGSHDSWIALLLAAVAHTELIPEPLIQYRQHGGNQIGAVKKNVLGRLSGVRETGRWALEQHLAELAAVRKRLDLMPGVPATYIALLDERIAHLSVRVALPEPRVHRLPMIGKEWRTGRYQRAANGWSSVLRDLLIQ